MTAERRALFQALGVAVLAALTGAVAGPLGILIALALAAWILRGEAITWADIGFGRPPRAVAAQTIVTFVTALVLTGLLGALLEGSRIGPPDLGLLEALEGDLPALLILLALSWTIAAFGEELLARGFLLHWLARGFRGVPNGFWLANLSQALLFGLGHAYQGPSGVLLTGFLGFLFGICVRLTGSLWPAILAHGLINTLTLVAAYLGG
ncbi:MAG: lysostaphin resistance A-like protein [Rhodothalassiaceae bacterium]